MNWTLINKFTSSLFSRHSPSFSVGAERAGDIASEAPRAWWDQRGIVDAGDPQQPQALDLTDLHLLGWKGPL
jgi:hypothetical protein